jgi:ubiquitin carboxyl-terminal hydrolase 1
MARTDGRWAFVSGGLTSFSDLSRSMPGEDARFAARECTEAARILLIKEDDERKRVFTYRLSFLEALSCPFCECDRMAFLEDVGKLRLEILDGRNFAHMSACVHDHKRLTSTFLHANNNEHQTTTHYPDTSPNLTIPFQSIDSIESLCLAMNPHDQRLRDLFDGDPNIFPGYHQDYREGIHGSNTFTRPGFILPLIFCFIPIVYHIFFLLDYDLLPLPELLWNILVYVTPSRLLDAIETYKNPLRISNSALKGIPRTHAAKSEAMRRLLGLDKPGGIIGSVAQAGRRRLSTLPGINMTAQAAEGRPAGLGNWDNSCYQNSVLQGLASLDSLSGYLTNPKIEEELVEGVSKPEMKMAEALKGLIATLNDPANNGKRIWTPATLKNMSSWQQQDAQEYFSKVLDEIDKEVGRVAKLIQTSQGFESDDSSDSKSVSSEALPISTFRNPLEGLIAQRVGCTQCGYSEGLSMIPFNCLTVPLGKAWEYDLPECLDEYTKLEQIDGVECGKCTLLKFQRQLSTIFERTKDTAADSPVHQQCKERLEAVNEALEEDDYEDKTLNQKCKISPKNRVSSTKSRQAVIARPPKSLVVHVNRSLFDELTGELKKNYSMVRFPKNLDLGPWCLGSSGAGEDATTEEWLLNPDQPMIASTISPSRMRGPIYELRAVVTHYGRHENGHYICYKKHPRLESEEGEQKEQWWRLSDDDVTKVTEETVLSQGGVFMLFYDCIELASPVSPTFVVEEPTSIVEQTPVEPMSSEPLETATEEPISSIEGSSPSDLLAVAANTPLPSIDDDDLSENEYQESLLTTREESVATSISEYDSEENGQGIDETYEPAKAIVVPSYIQQTGVHSSEGAKENISPSSSLVMV